MGRTPLFALVLLVASTPLPASADLTIDDFELGAFSFSTGTTTSSQTQFSLPPSNTLGGQRSVTIQALTGGETVSAELVLTGGDDGASLTSDSSGGQFSHAYNDFGLPTLDLTDGGNADRIEVVLSQAGATGTLELELLDDLSGFDGPIQPLAGPGTYVFPFSALSSVDPSRIQILQVDIDATAAGTFVISEVRAAATPSIPVVSDGGKAALVVLLLTGALMFARRGTINAEGSRAARHAHR